jgi:Predicted transcriptional regulator
MLESEQQGGLPVKLNAVVSTVDYGKIVITLDKVLQEKGITKNKLATLTNLDYRVISRLHDDKDNVVTVDLDFLARICYVLNCSLSEIVQYEK